jgi:hypothetical protein
MTIDERTMRIGLITGKYPPGQGGVVNFTREIGKALAALSHDAHVITGDLKSPSIAWQSGLGGVKWLAGHKRLLRAERIAAYRQVLRSGLRGKRS